MISFEKGLNQVIYTQSIRLDWKIIQSVFYIIVRNFTKNWNLLARSYSRVSIRFCLIFHSQKLFIEWEDSSRFFYCERKKSPSRTQSFSRSTHSSKWACYQNAAITFKSEINFYFVKFFVIAWLFVKKREVSFTTKQLDLFVE